MQAFDTERRYMNGGTECPLFRYSTQIERERERDGEIDDRDRWYKFEDRT